MHIDLWYPWASMDINFVLLNAWQFRELSGVLFFAYISMASVPGHLTFKGICASPLSPFCSRTLQPKISFKYNFFFLFLAWCLNVVSHYRVDGSLVSLAAIYCSWAEPHMIVLFFTDFSGDFSIIYYYYFCCCCCFEVLAYPLRRYLVLFGSEWWVSFGVPTPTLLL